MSTGLAIAAVSAMLRDILNDWISSKSNLPSINTTVSTLAPDLIEETSDNQVNLFLYRVTPNTGWCNTGLPSRDDQGNRTDNQPLAIDLHYLLTAYAKKDFYAEALLGVAMQCLHEIPVLSRDAIRQRQNNSWKNDSDPLVKALANDTLASQAEQIKIVPQVLSPDEISKLWTATEMHYRPTAAYLASVVLIERAAPKVSPLPVLTRSVTAVAGLISNTPMLVSATPPKNQASVLLGDVLKLGGYNLDGSNVTIQFVNHKLRQTVGINPCGSPPCSNNNAFELDVAIDPAKSWHAGIYNVAVSLQRQGEAFLRTTNEISVSLAPAITLPIVVNKSPTTGAVTFTLVCNPEVLPEQQVSLIVGGTEIKADPYTQATKNLTFTGGIMAAAKYRVRLRVDGVDSLLVIQSDSGQLSFDNSQTVNVT